MQKLIIVLILLFSCSSIDYNFEPEKQFIDDGSIQICTKRLLYVYKSYDHFGINEKIQRYFILDSSKKVYIKNLPLIWQNLGFKVVMYDKFNDQTWSSINANSARYIVIYKKSHFFDTKLHAADLHEYYLWQDGSFKLIVDDPESGNDEIVGYPDSTNDQFIQIWALSIIDDNKLLQDSILLKKE